MRGEFIPILIVFIVIGLPIICGTLISLAKIMRGGDNRPSGSGRRRNDKEEHDEAHLIQEIHRGLSRMERRIEALETIVIQSENKKPSSTTTHE